MESVNSTGYKFSQSSLSSLNGVHPDLVACVVIALYKFTEIDFTVLEGARSKKRQYKLVSDGKSWTTKSKHLIQDDGFSHAVDLAPWVDGGIPWDDWSAFKTISEAMLKAAEYLNVQIKWGGDWDVKDGLHYQLQT